MKIENIGEAVRFATYSSRMLDDPAGIAEELRLSAAEKGVEFDTIVGRGSSGMLIVPVVARILGKKWFIVRKDEEVQSSHDSSCKWMGDLGKRWVFLDDFCSSGQTFRKVRDGVKAAVKEATAPYQTYGPPPNDPTGRHDLYTYERPAFETELVGYYQYESRDADCCEFIPWDEGAQPGYNDMYWDDAPSALAKKARKAAEAVALAEKAHKAAEAGAVIKAEATPKSDVEQIEELLQPMPEYKSIIGQCGMPNCIFCSDKMTDALYGDDVEIKTWGSPSLTATRYALQLASYTNPQSNMIVRGI